MSDLPTGFHKGNARYQAWNLMSDLPTGLHTWNARLVVLRLNVPVNNFSVMSGRSHRFLGN